MKLPKILDRLEKLYGKSKRRGPSNPYEMLLHRNCGYPQSDDRCDSGFRALKEAVGLEPAKILAVSGSRLAKVMRESKSGMIPEKRAQRLKEIAAYVQTKFGGNLEALRSASPAEARKVLKQFPTVGDSGADRILLFSGISPVAAIPANGVRVPLRIAFGHEQKNYAASYRVAQEYLEAEIPAKLADRQRAYLLLKTHGEELCKTSKPLCDSCPVSSDCAYFHQTRTQR